MHIVMTLDIVQETLGTQPEQRENDRSDVQTYEGVNIDQKRKIKHNNIAVNKMLW